MRGIFAALGVGIVHVVVKGVLVPFLWHFQQVILTQQGPHNARRAPHGLMKFVGQRQLAVEVAVRAHKVFHDLHKHAGRIVLQRRMRGVQHFVVQAAQGLQPLAGAASGKAFKQNNNGAGKAQAVGRGHFDNAVGVQARFWLPQGVIVCTRLGKGIYHLNELVVLPVEQQRRIFLARLWAFASGVGCRMCRYRHGKTLQKCLWMFAGPD